MSDTSKKARKPWTSRIGKIDVENVLTNIPLPNRLSRNTAGVFHPETVALHKLFDSLTVAGQCFVLPFLGSPDNLAGVRRRLTEMMTRRHKRYPDCRMTLRGLRGLDNKGDKVTHIGVWRIK